jgi:membrane protease YdiL (CAAX protease family)
MAFLALVLTLLAGGIWSALLIANLKVSPSAPWSIVAMAIVLRLLWLYLHGRGWPASTAEARRRRLRARRLPPRVLAWALLAGALSIVALSGIWIFLFQLARARGNALPDFSAYPPVTVALALIMASVVGGLTEEAGFRGYLQAGLERDFGGPAAVVLGALALAPGHGLTQGFAWPTVCFYFLADVMFGLTAYLTQSIVPGILVHIAGLLTFFTLIWPHDPSRLLVAAGGADAWFWAHVTQGLVFSALAILAFRRLSKVAGSPPEARPSPESQNP